MHTVDYNLTYNEQKCVLFINELIYPTIAHIMKVETIDLTVWQISMLNIFWNGIAF